MLHILKALLDSCDIQDEGKLFAGCINVVRNRISDRDMDDMSLYNADNVIEKKLNYVFLSFCCNNDSLELL
uniref:Uncharacterized protein n=1 Tax=Parascaris univalens TaxID=6257 RepID=A0A915BVM5_PARUN